MVLQLIFVFNRKNFLLLICSEINENVKIYLRKIMPIASLVFFLVVQNKISLDFLSQISDYIEKNRISIFSST